ncbi:SCARECROW-LIKE protein 7 [Sesamum alatum]|uniref:SCARECROW-LIKE protein 7 n=1 Tax=Sesamum alatum TaxID=300844 RepID=A0AAE1XVM5_9LAMI|nr:SCARECROW-LIKE protein 7 [Sesamum alatum]
MQSELLLPPMSTFNFTCSDLNHNTSYDQEMDFCGIDDSDFSCSFTSLEESSAISSSNSYVPTMLPDEFFDLENLVDDIQIYPAMDGLEIIPTEEIEDICEWINGNDAEGEEWSSCLSLESGQNSIASPFMDEMSVADEMQVDDQLTLLHLMRAYGEAIDNGENELAEVIVKSINEKTNPLGNTMERVAYNLFQSTENQGEYLRQESSKNFVAAFKALYQSIPNGRFAHFTANSAILESVPDDAATIQIVDFDMGEGIQWPPLIEALSRKQKAMRLTSVKTEEECTSSCWNFEDAKKRLLAHARQYGVELQIEEKSIEDFACELMRMTERGQGREWLVFNCMVGLPHMGRRRSRRSVAQFVKVARELLANVKGILTFGDGEAGESLNTCCTYTSYFDNLLRHYQALFESLEGNFPVYLAEARTAMESLFLAPFMSPIGWSRDWEEMTKSCGFHAETRLEGRRLSEESLAEAKQMVNEREHSYRVTIERLRENEMVLRWRETPLVRVSTWV